MINLWIHLVRGDLIYNNDRWKYYLDNVSLMFTILFLQLDIGEEILCVIFKLHTFVKYFNFQIVMEGRCDLL